MAQTNEEFVKENKLKAKECFERMSKRYDKANGNEKLYIEESCSDMCPWYGEYCDGF